MLQFRKATPSKIPRIVQLESFAEDERLVAVEVGTGELIPAQQAVWRARQAAGGADEASIARGSPASPPGSPLGVSAAPPPRSPLPRPCVSEFRFSLRGGHGAGHSRAAWARARAPMRAPASASEELQTE